MEFKGPTEVKSITKDWSADLGTDTISTSVWVLDAGVTNVADSKTNSDVTVKISGGTEGNTYKLVNTIVTAGGETLVEEWYLRIQHQRSD